MAISARFKQLTEPNFQQPFLSEDHYAKKNPKLQGSGITYPTANWMQNVYLAIKSSPEIPQNVPTSSTSSGTAGQISFDATHIYVCVAPNTWMRATLSSF
jgi:hypothetical protein